MYYFLGFLTFVLFVVANVKSGKRKPEIRKSTLTIEKIFMAGLFVIMFSILAFQSVESNSDLINYKNSYYEHVGCSTQYAMGMVFDHKDPIYFLVTFGLQRAGLSFYGWHYCIAFFYLIALFLTVDRYSSNIYISMIVALTLGSYSFAFSGLRQTIAISFVMIAFKYLVEKKIPKFVILVVLGSLFHGTALIFLIAYPLYHFKFKKRNVVIVLACAAIVIFNAERLMKFYLSVTGMEEDYSSYYDRDVALSLSGTLISISIFLFCVIAVFAGKGKARYKGLCNVMVVPVAFDILSYLMFAELFRVGMYFSVFNVLLITEACVFDCEKSKLFSKVKVFVVTLLLVAYYFISPSINLVDYVSRI